MPEQLCTQLPRAALEFAGHYAVNEKLEALLSMLVDKLAGAAATAAIAATGAAWFRELASTFMSSFKAMNPEHEHFCVRLVRIVLAHPGAWLTGNALRGGD